jgi:hypothetical protein
MKRLAALPAVALLATAACTDNPKRAHEPTAPNQPSLAVAPIAGGSTVCLSYLRELNKLKTLKAHDEQDLHKAPDAARDTKIKKMEAMLFDACN